MKTIALFGATGQSGRPFLPLALQAGYRVVALVRDPAKITQPHLNLTLVPGNILDPAAVAETCREADVVVSLIGHVKGSPTFVQTDGTQNIINALQQRGAAQVKIVSLTGGAVPFPAKDQPKLPDRIFSGIMKLVAGTVLADAIRHAQVLAGSGLPHVIVRGPRLTNDARRGQYRVGWVGVNASTKIARADLADFLLTQVESDEFVGQMPFVSY